MKKYWKTFVGTIIVILCVCAGVFYAKSQSVDNSTSDAAKPKAYMGKMTPFWRNRPVIGEWMVGGQGLEEIPPFMLDDSITFKYIKRPYPIEIPFTDDINMVRILGGWKKADNNYYGVKGDDVENYDLTYRNAAGKIEYRWVLLKGRIDPYIEAGYTKPRIVLDNTPWCFPEKAAEPEGEGFGQANPPRDYKEWQIFIEELCKKLVEFYGYDRVNTWSFRLGTEAGAQRRFNGSLEEYIKFYDYTEAAVKKVLPGAGFGPYNLSGDAAQDYAAIADHAKSQPNIATGQKGIKLDWIANSVYSIGKMKDGEISLAPIDPDIKARIIADGWNEISEAALNGFDLPREIHEYGWFLINEYGIRENEPGARGAAGNFHLIMNLRKEGMDRLYQWGAFDSVRAGSDTLKFLESQGWLWSILEYTRGGDTYELSTILPETTDEKIQRYKSIGIFDCSNKQNYIITSSYNLNRHVKAEEPITVMIPKDILRVGKRPVLKYTCLSDENDIFNSIKEDLNAQGLLKTDFQKIDNMVANINTMTNNKRQAAECLKMNYPKYVNMMKDSLTLKKYNGRIVDKGSYYELTLKMKSPMVMVVTIE